MKNWMNPRLVTGIFLCLCIPVFLPSAPLAQDNPPKRALVLHSYHRGLPWDDAIAGTIDSILKKDAPKIVIQTEYMDTKRIYDATYMRQLYEIYRYKFKNRKFDVIISVDNNALIFLVEHRDALFPGTPVVFCGVNNFQDSMLKGQDLYTGVVEAIEVKGTIDIALKLHPKTKQIIIYGTDTPTYFANKEVVKKAMPFYKGSVDVNFVEGLNIKEVQDHVRKLPDHSIVLLIASMEDEKGARVLFRQFAEMVDAVSHVPQYSLWDFVLGYGILGGKIISGVAQGEAAARMALRILQGEKVANIPVLKESPNRFMFDYNQMKRFGLSPSDLPQESILINTPSSLYSRHKGLVWTVIITIVSLLLFIAALGINIVRRRRAEVALGESEERYRDLFEQSRDAIAIVTRDGRFIDVNRSFSDLFGYKREELMRMNAGDLWADPSGRSRWQDEMKEKGSVSDYAWKGRRKDGEVRDLMLSSTERRAEDGTTQYQTIARDITDRKKYEKALQQSEQYFRRLLSNMHEDIFVIDSDYRIEDVNNSVLVTSGFKRDDVIGRHCFEVSHGFNQPCDKVGEECRFKEVFRTGKPRNCLHKHLHAEGGEIWADILLSPLKDETGKVTHIIEAVRDITDVIQVKEALVESEKTARQYLDIAGVTFVALDREGNIVLINQRGTELLGYRQEELLNRNWFKTCLPERLQEDVLNVFHQLIRGEVAPVEYYENPVLTKDGEERVVAWHNAVLRNPGGEIVGIISSGEDITETKRLESQLRQAQKMEAIGTLASGIAHDFNNILSAIIGYAELTREDVADHAVARGNLEGVLKAGERARDLVQQILTFTRESEKDLIPIRPHVIIKEALKLLRASIPASIEIREKISTFGKIMADPTQIHQIIMNLCTNAYHAMLEEGGVLGVDLQDEELRMKNDALNLAPGKYLRLTVSDTGHGITPEVMERIFDPYFTTKEKGRGTGLGLSVVHGVVEAHGGAITVESTPGEGAVFHVYFPGIEEAEEGMEAGPEEPLPAGTERILFVDDEPTLAHMNKKRLERLGYDVATRTSSVEALELFREKPDRFDLVITDMTMPQMAGDRLAKELMKIRTDIPIILCTGFSERISGKKAAEMGIRAFLMKPISAKDLAETVREVLNVGDIAI